MAETKAQALQMLGSGVAPAEVARQLGISPATVRTWKSRMGQPGKTKRNVSSVSQKMKRNASNETLHKMVAAADDNPDLTEQQKRFCLLYAQRPNATRAYRLAFDGCAYSTANAEGPRLLVNPCIREEVARQKKIVMQQLMADPADLFKLYWDIAFADLSDFIEWGRAEVPVMGPFGPIEVKNPNDPEGEKQPLTKEINEVRFLESTEVDGTLLAEVKQGKDGASVKLSDRMAAMRWLSDYFEQNPADRHRREYDRRRLALQEAKAGAHQSEINEEQKVAQAALLEAIKGATGED